MAKHWITKNLQLFSGAVQTENFRHMPMHFPVRVLRRSEAPTSFHDGRPIELPVAHEYAGTSHESAAFLTETDTVGLLVLQEGRRVFERYWHGMNASIQWPIWSVVKSFIGTLVGSSLADGVIRSIDDAIDDYVPALQGSAYDGASIRSILQMSSGARWNENYADPESDLRRRSAALAGGSLDAVVAGCVREHPPGTNLRYNTNDTHALGMLLRRAHRESLSGLLRRKLWEPLGMQYDAFWRIDGEGVEDAGAGLHATLGDVCRLGQVYLEGGRWNAERVVPASWVVAASQPDGAHVTPGVVPGYEFGYGYHWWLPGRAGEFSAIGIYNQYLYINAIKRVVVAKFSANRNWGRSYDEAGYRDQQHMALFRAIADGAYAANA